jgi:hypothetical protein
MMKSLWDFSALRPLPGLSTANCHWPVLAHGHQLGLCWGAQLATVNFVGDEVTSL